MNTSFRRPVSTLLVILAGFLIVAVPVPAAEKAPPTIAEYTKTMDRQAGFFPLYWDEPTGWVLLEIETFDREFLFVEALRTGIGSNPLGLDRGQLGAERVVHFHRVGPRVLLIQRNLDFRALTEDSSQRAAVEESFAQSVLWGAEIVAVTERRVLVDATPWLLQDHHGVAERIKGRGEGDFALDKQRSAVHRANTKSFPDNTELEAILTYGGSGPGRLLRETTPDPTSLTVYQRLSLIRLPDSNYTPRTFDPRAGLFSLGFADYAAPLDQPLEKRFIMRHRLHKKYPDSAISEPVVPIIYYVDPAIPDPLMAAVLEGSRWWSEAFEAAGFRNAFDVRVRPDTIDPLDVRYNVIQWVHRSTRGWSYGSSVSDPRTGEIIKGHVSLGSLRARHDRLLFDGFLPFENRAGDGHECAIGWSPSLETMAGAPGSNESINLALARLRQLSAHEIGHTLGLAHNFAASTYDRGSVMDYPAPLVKLNPQDSTFDFSQAYAEGIGIWDRIAVRYAYSEVPAVMSLDSALAAVLAEAIRDNLLYISDADARADGAAHPLASLWDNGADPVAELKRLMAVRRAALARLSPDNLLAGQPLSELEKVLVPVYLSHRYQLTAAAKSIAGIRYSYALHDDGQTVHEIVAPQQQEAALRALLATLEPDELMLPEAVISHLTPPAPGFRADRETFEGYTAPAFDEFAAAEIAVDLTLAELLQPNRCARLVQQHSFDQRFMSLDYLLDRLLDATWRGESSSDSYRDELVRVVQRAVVRRLVALAGDSKASPAVGAVVSLRLSQLAEELSGRAISGPPIAIAHRDAIVREIDRFLSREAGPVEATEGLSPPPGSPIGN